MRNVRNNKYLVTILLMGFMLLALNASSQSQKVTVKVPTKTILDYYLLLPEAYLGCNKQVESSPTIIPKRNTQEKAALMSKISYTNIRKGYIETTARTVALFKDRERGIDYILIANNSTDENCPAIGVTILKLDSMGKYWHQNTDILPPAYVINKEYFYLLPEQGTSIAVYDSKQAYMHDKDSVLYKLLWKEGGFSVSLNDTEGLEINSQNLQKHGLIPEYAEEIIEEEFVYEYFHQIFQTSEHTFIAGVFCRPDCQTEMCNDEYDFYQYDTALHIWVKVTEKVFPEEHIIKQLENEKYLLEDQCLDCEGFRFYCHEEHPSQLEVHLTSLDEDYARKTTYGAFFELKDGMFNVVSK